MTDDMLKLLSGDVLEEDVEMTLAELCQVCKLTADQVLDLVDYGVVEPVGRQPSRWRFRGVSVWRIRCARRLEQDLGVNTAGAALALELLEELEHLRMRLRRFEES